MKKLIYIIFVILLFVLLIIKGPFLIRTKIQHGGDSQFLNGLFWADLLGYEFDYYFSRNDVTIINNINDYTLIIFRYASTENFQVQRKIENFICKDIEAVNSVDEVLRFIVFRNALHGIDLDNNRQLQFIKELIVGINYDEFKYKNIDVKGSDMKWDEYLTKVYIDQRSEITPIIEQFMNNEIHSEFCFEQKNR